MEVYFSFSHKKEKNVNTGSISTFVGYLKPKASLPKYNSHTIYSTDRR